MPENPFQLDYNILHHVATSMWIKTLWQFQQQHNICIEMDLPKLNTAQMNDQFLMTNFIQVGISGTKLAQINWCQLYLQATMLANICNGSGEYVTPNIWAGKPNQTFMTGYKWPNHGCPMKKDWIYGNWH